MSHHYRMAEKFWLDEKYFAAVSEFEKVMNKDLSGNLGLEATYQAAMIQYVFLSQPLEAVKKFRLYTRLSTDSKKVLGAQIHIGDILFGKLEQYDQAITHYQNLLHNSVVSEKVPEFLFRIGKSHFFLFHFQEAVCIYRELMKKYPSSPWAEKAGFELGVSFFTSAEREVKTGAYRDAMNAYEQFIKTYPQSYYVPEARFGIASCLEELDQMEEAMKVYETLKANYPSENVINIKISKIKERMAQYRVIY